MNLSLFALTLGCLTVAAALAARRDRLFVVVALFAAGMTVDALLYSPLFRYGRYDPRQPVLLVAVALTLAEAIGLPRRIAELTRLGLRSATGDYDVRLWRLIAPFEQALANPRVRMAGAAREKAALLATGVAQRLGKTRPPTAAWAAVRDGYVEAVETTRTNLSIPDPIRDPQTAWLSATTEPARSVVTLRTADTTMTRRRPPWAALILLITLPFTIYGPLDVANRTVIAPERPYTPPTSQPVAAGWSRTTLPRGDSWGGGAVTDGSHVFLVSREDVDGFYGVTRVSASTDGGETWSAPGDASNDDVANTARPAITVGPDGTVWVAFVRKEATTGTQTLQIGQSIDAGSHWRGLIRTSPIIVAYVGLPALLVTPAVRLVAYTDAASGAAIVQQMGPIGRAVGPSRVLGTTNRELYSNAEFLDAGVALAAIGTHVVALWHSTDTRIEVSLSDDAGATWRNGPTLEVRSGWAQPHLIVSGGRFIATVDRVGPGGRVTQLILDGSDDFGTTWHGDGIASGDGQWALEGLVAHDGDRWTLTYVACEFTLGCTNDGLQVWFRESADGRSWSEPQPLTGLGNFGVVGTGTTGGRDWAVWLHYLSANDEDRVLEGATRPAP